MQGASTIRIAVRGMCCALVAAAVPLVLPAPEARAAAARCNDPLALVTPPAPGAPLQFGIYPGGAAGSVNGKPDPAPENPTARAAALRSLAGTSRLGIHIYTAYTGNAKADAATAIWVDGEIAAYTAAGHAVELVVRYKPNGLDTDAAVAGFADEMRATIRRYGGDPLFTSLQVTNEANLLGSPDASDGAFAGASRALVAGVIAAKGEVRRSGNSQVRIGFNWASDARAAESTEFWATLGRLGGAAFRDAVDWVGLDAYPGTFFPALQLTTLLPQLAGTAMTDALRHLRTCLMPMAGLGQDVALHVSENGFPTGPGRSSATQAAVLDAMVRSVNRLRGTYNITDYNWFDLRDSRTDDQNFESQYGLMTDRYTPKPGFARYRDLIAELSGPGAPAAPVPASTVACSPSPVTVRIPRTKGWQTRLVRIRRGGKTVRTLVRPRTPTRVKVTLAPGRARMSMRIHARRGGRNATRLLRQTFLVCAPRAR